MRLDCQVSSLFQITRSQAALHIKNGEIYVNGIQTTKASLSISRTSIVDLIVKIDPMFDITLDIIYEDECLAVIQKKSGEVMHGAPGHDHVHSLAYAIEKHFGDALSDINGPLERGLVHRLDKDTSGIFVIAKNNGTHRCLQGQIKTNQMTRKYIACVASCVNQSAEWNNLIVRAGRQKMKVSIESNNCPINHSVALCNQSDSEEKRTAFSKYAITLINPIWFTNKFSIIECIIKTGIQHQIRAQCTYHGHPIINDQIYGKNNKIKLLDDYTIHLDNRDQQLLHAYSLELIHPTTKRHIKFDCLPEWYGFWNKN